MERATIFIYAPPYTGKAIHKLFHNQGERGCAASRALDKVWDAESANFNEADEFTPDLKQLDKIESGMGYPAGIAVDP